MSTLTKEKKKTELEQEEFGMEFSPEELEVTEEKYMKELNSFVLTEEQNNFLHFQANLRKLMKDSIVLLF